jgi:nicotinamidase-related amidase
MRPERAGERLPRTAGLLLIDVQKAIDHPSWGRRNNPRAEENIGGLLDAWRASARPIIHVRHVSREPRSTFRPGQEGCDFKEFAQPKEGELIIEKHTPNAFIGTELDVVLRSNRILTLAIVGFITNNSVEATARMAGNLGYETLVVSDATATFDGEDFEGRFRSAEEIHAMSLANLQGDYATVLSTEEVLHRAD